MDVVFGFGRLQTQAEQQQRALRCSVCIDTRIRFEHNIFNGELCIMSTGFNHGFKMRCTTQTIVLVSYIELNYNCKYLNCRVILQFNWLEQFNHA